MMKKNSECKCSNDFHSESSDKNNGCNIKPKKITWRGVRNRFGDKDQLKEWHKQQDIISSYVDIFKEPDELIEKKTKDKAMLCLFLMEEHDFLTKEMFDQFITRRIKLEHIPLFKKYSLWGMYRGLLEVELRTFGEVKRRVIKLDKKSNAYNILNNHFPRGISLKEKRSKRNKSSKQQNYSSENTY